MEVPESTQRRTHKRQKQIELALFTLCDGSFVFWDVMAEISAQVMVRCQITRIGPVVGIGSILVVRPTYEPQHYKTNKMTSRPSENSDQPGHPRILISVFAVHTTQWFFMRTAKTLIRLDISQVWSDPSLGAEVILLVWLFGGSYIASHAVKRF